MANSSKKSTSSQTSTKTVNTQNQSNDNMKYEIANELGVKLGADATARQNGHVGGEMTRRLVESAKNNQKSSK